MTPSEQHRPEIIVGLVATPPDYPARVAARLTAELTEPAHRTGGRRRAMDRPGRLG